MQDHAAANRLRRELQPGERLIWVGQPTPSGLARSKVPESLQGLPFLGFSLFWLYMANRGGAPTLFQLFGVPFVAVGLWMVAAIPRARFLAERTVYGVTNMRALRVVDGPFSQVSSWGAAQINALRRRDYADGNGTVVFHQMQDYRFKTVEGFHGIADARGAEAALIALRDGRA